MRRVLQVLLATGLCLGAVLVTPGSALAYIGQRGDPHPLGLVNVVLIFVVAPLGVFAVVAVLCLRPQRGTGSLRYRPGRAWPYEATWFGTRAPAAVGDEDAVTGAGGASGSW